jgi:hypothetical protein
MDKEELAQLQRFSNISVFLIITGNTMNYSLYLFLLLYKPIQKQCFYIPLKKFHRRYISKQQQVVTIEENEILINKF